MRQKNVCTLGEEDDKAVQLFAKLGMPKNMAKTLLYLSQVPECKSADIEQCANMRQPEVSNTITELRRKGWVKKRDLKKKGKGRPVHIYEPTVDLSEILKDFERKKLKEVESAKSDLSELENIIASR